MLKCGIKKKEGIKSSASAVISIGHSTIQGFRLFADKFNQLEMVCWQIQSNSSWSESLKSISLVHSK